MILHHAIPLILFLCILIIVLLIPPRPLMTIFVTYMPRYDRKLLSIMQIINLLLMHMQHITSINSSKRVIML